MKQKLFIALAISGLLASPLGIAAGMDGTDDGSGLQNLAMDNTNAVMQNPGATEPGNAKSADAHGAGAPNANDEMSADTATGDDDY